MFALEAKNARLKRWYAAAMTDNQTSCAINKKSDSTRARDMWVCFHKFECHQIRHDPSTSKESPFVVFTFYHGQVTIHPVFPNISIKYNDRADIFDFFCRAPAASEVHVEPLQQPRSTGAPSWLERLLAHFP